ncbi:DUF2306 domain-containing protein [Paenibacillus lautus]|jgi:uncharacterized membrane protein YozB (DUF420 family)|uniref:DUF2306 domain-containing protein n=1 Tax=Paenibacillus lautus TaxID=1401 RepID=A0A385TPR9_PAELA|nr:DUF2306 domain-containing protein [Paenibacillus lautus]AYB44572.1 DUF2306 domain-containing protein [Paenibacillus lautus]MBY0162201.1 DUF2306 domain-containing protein [Cytobacillus firmus]MCI1776213.1 DUF2306 domain-containing protein [Paenibacillus lautus]VTR61623.1 Predicted membrane protein (DUF2306) [Actinobacillus pleuropneumoniae]
MKNRKSLYRLLACVSLVFILYALVKNYWIDPGAAGFLSRKTGLKRELNLPVWLNVMYVHVGFACLAMASGLINFSNRIFEKSRRFHRFNGYVYLVSVLLVVLTSGYMAPYATGGKISSMGFNALNLIWLFVTTTAFIQIKRKRIDRHRNWMIRSYAFCFTNLLIHLITSLVHHGFGMVYATSYTIGLYGSIALLIIIPEIIIRTKRKEWVIE